jgi:hypothetical protein
MISQVVGTLISFRSFVDIFFSLEQVREVPIISFKKEREGGIYKFYLVSPRRKGI